jgi:hypothetical protein
VHSERFAVDRSGCRQIRRRCALPSNLGGHLSAAANCIDAPDRPELFGALLACRDAVGRWLPASEQAAQAEQAASLAEDRRLVDSAPAKLARRGGLAWTRLPPRWTYLVVLDGRQLGTFRATPSASVRPCGKAGGQPR